MAQATAAFRLAQDDYAELQRLARSKGISPSALIRELVVGQLSGRKVDPQVIKGASAREAELMRITAPFTAAGSPAPDKPFLDENLEILRQRAKRRGISASGMLGALLAGALAPGDDERRTGEHLDGIMRRSGKAEGSLAMVGLSHQQVEALINQAVAEVRKPAATPLPAKATDRKKAGPPKPVADAPFEFQSPRLQDLARRAAVEKITTGGLLPGLLAGALSAEAEAANMSEPTLDELRELIAAFEAAQ